MKHIYIILLAVILGNYHSLAQDSKKMDLLREKVLKEYEMYFRSIELTENGQLSLSALEEYFLQPIDSKKEIIRNISSEWKESLVLVHLDDKNELWGKSKETGNVMLIDSWGERQTLPSKTEVKEIQKFSKHPWFFYVGEQGMFDSDHNISLSLNTRVGFFLLMNRWDLAATYSINFSGNSDNDDIIGQTNVGIMSKFYFPIKKYNISPNVGGEISMLSYRDAQSNTTQTLNKSLLIGVSWFVGFGSLDIGIQTGQEVTTMVGFTFFPKFKKKGN
jgi:hypothetical protein